MLKNTLKFFVAIVTILLLASLIAWAGGDGGARFQFGPFNVSVFALCCGISFLINWLAFIPANYAKTEKYYDLVGSFTFISIISAALLLNKDVDARVMLAAGMVFVWALRLGSYLFMRIQRHGKDSRFDEIKQSSLRFFIAWSLQGLWVMITSACVLAIVTGRERAPLGWLDYFAIGVWLFGFATEVIADWQKSVFKRNALNNGKFISSGVWSWSRHPNYFGEMVLWFAPAILAIPILNGWQWLCLISPIFVFVLINYISGVNKLELAADDKWAEDEAYQAYKKRTSILVPLPPKS